MSTDSIDYEEVIRRITDIYNSCNDSEKAIFSAILSELADKGYSQTLEQVWLTDFTEIPVSIDKFITDPLYLGETNDNGNMVYPFWRKSLNEIFNESKNYSEIIFSGATRIGKTSTAITCMCYMLYRLMIYRDPHKFFKKKSVSKFTVAFANLTKELAKGVGYAEYNTTLKMSEWFNKHGHFSKSESNYYYIPDGNRIEIIPASDSAHLLGKQLWCFTGNTKILTNKGPRKLEDLADKVVIVRQYCFPGQTLSCLARVIHTKDVKLLAKVTLSDGSSFTCTPDHRLLSADLDYCEAQNLYRGYQLYNPNNINSNHIVDSVDIIRFIHEVPVYDVVNAGIFHNFIVYDDTTHSQVVAHNCLLMDEVNFTRSGVKDINKAKVSMKSMYDTGNARITGTFKIAGQVYGKMFTCSSKNSDSDYLSDHIETQLNAGNNSMYLVDEPQWKVLPASMFSNDRFYIAVGDRYKKGFIIPEENSDDVHLESYRQEGYEVLEVPKDFYSNFKADFDISLRDIAGISVVGSMGFITQESVTVNVTTERQNPFYFDIIVCGVNDNETIERNFHIQDIPKDLLKHPTYIHIDFAEVSDHIGICGVVQDGTKVVTDIESKKVVMPFFKQVFQIAIEAPRGDRMSFQKVLNFIVWLRKQGMNVYKVTTDQFQSSYAREVLGQKGFSVDKVSVDISQDPYIALRNVLQDQRIELVKHQLQEDELVHLQRVNGRIDHPPQSSNSGSEDNYSRSGAPGNGYGKGIGKDCADALAGSLWSAIQDGNTVTLDSKKTVSLLSALNSKGYQSDKMPSVFGMNTNYRF